jgi:hypothetical protein
VKYEIRIEDGLDEGWTAWFDGMQIINEPCGVTVITGVVADQSALHGVLAKVRDLGLPLLSLQRIDSEHRQDQSKTTSDRTDRATPRGTP